MAKKFLFICAGLFLLAGAYALGARTAGAQSDDPLVGIDFTLNTTPCIGPVAVSRSGAVYAQCEGGSWSQVSSVPGRVAAIAGPGQGIFGVGLLVICENGNLYASSTRSWNFSFLGNVRGATVGAARHSLGDLKARYR